MISFADVVIKISCVLNKNLFGKVYFIIQVQPNYPQFIRIIEFRDNRFYCRCYGPRITGTQGMLKI